MARNVRVPVPYFYRCGRSRRRRWCYETRDVPMLRRGILRRLQRVGALLRLVRRMTMVAAAAVVVVVAAVVVVVVVVATTTIV